MFGKPKKFVVSTSDLDAAMAHLNSLPMSITAEMPETWGRQQILTWLSESMPKTLKIGDHFEVLTGVWGHVVPVGFGYSDYSSGGDRLLVVLSIRHHNTDLDNMCDLNSV